MDLDPYHSLMISRALVIWALGAGHWMLPFPSFTDGVRWYSGTSGLGFFVGVFEVVGASFRFMLMILEEPNDLPRSVVRLSTLNDGGKARDEHRSEHGVRGFAVTIPDPRISVWVRLIKCMQACPEKSKTSQWTRGEY